MEQCHTDKDGNPRFPSLLSHQLPIRISYAQIAAHLALVEQDTGTGVIRCTLTMNAAGIVSQCCLSNTTRIPLDS